MVVSAWLEETCTVIHAVGELDVFGAPRLREALDEAWASADHPHLVIDLTEVPFCDSVGLGVLVATLNRANQMDRRLILVLEPGMITHLLTITNLDRHFETSLSVDEACAALGAAA